MSATTATLTVPADHAGLFHQEARDTLEMAAGNLDEALRWHREGRGEPERIGKELAKVRKADHLFAQIGDQRSEYRIEADPKTLAVTLQGCLIEAAERVHDTVESAIGREGRADVRLAVAELELWLGMLEAVEDGN